MTEAFVMLVDDEVPYVEITAKRLGVRNFKIIEAFSAEECLEKLMKHPELDVIVLDISMPGMDGIEALKEIKNISPLTEVIMLTGHGTIDSAIGALKLGAYDFLKKPCEIKEISEKILAAARKKQAHDERINVWESFRETSTLEGLMVPLSEYATVSEDANILEAFAALEKAQKAFDPKRYRHRAVLVVDKEMRVKGKLSQHDIIQALEPRYKKSKERKKGALEHFGFSQKFIESVSLQYSTWDKPLQNLYRKALEQKVKSFMYEPTEGEYIDVSATMNETIHRMVVGKHHSLLVKNGADIVGVVRLTDVFEFIRLRLKTMQLSAKKENKINIGNEE